MLNEYIARLLRFYRNNIVSTLSRQDIDADRGKVKEVLQAVLNVLENNQTGRDLSILYDGLPPLLGEKIKFIIELLSEEEKPWHSEFKSSVRKLFLNKLFELNAYENGDQLPAEIAQKIIVNLNDNDVKRAASLSHFWLNNAVDCYRSKISTQYNVSKDFLNAFTLCELQRISDGLAHLRKMSSLNIQHKNEVLSLFASLHKPSAWLIYLLADNVKKFGNVHHNLSDTTLMAYAAVTNSINILKGIASIVPDMDIFAISSSYSNAKVFNHIRILNPKLEMG